LPFMSRSRLVGCERIGLVLREVFRGNVTCSMKDANQLNFVFNRTIENQIAADWKAAKVWRQLLRLAADVRLGRDDIERGIKTVNEPIGRDEVATRNIGPNLVVIEPRLVGATNARHGGLTRGLLCCQPFAALDLDILRREFNEFPPISLLDAGLHLCSQIINLAAAN
jgi:hypothetical protein